MDTTTFRTHECNDMLVLSSERNICGYHLLYKLFEKKNENGITVYLISAELDGPMRDMSLCELGVGIQRAIRFLSLVSDNCVMPCTLEDVLQDYNYSELINIQNGDITSLQ